MKKLINEPKTVVNELCKGMIEANPNLLAYDEENVVISRKVKKRNKVFLISGGGSGHEPAHAGYVGPGMLDAAVCGDVFASPSVMQVYNAIKENHSDKGVLLIIKNYSGDVMNFENAADLAIEEEEVKVDSVIVNDDVAIEKKEDRRGVAGTLFVHKIAGAAAEDGASLEDCKRVAGKVIRNVRSMGVALKACTVPARGKPTFDLEADKIEMGVGIHGEAGIRRDKWVSVDEMAKVMTDKILKDLPFKSEDECALMINGFGGTPLQELYILNNEVKQILNREKIRVYKTFVGNYMTSIDMAGASISLLNLDSELKKLLSSYSNTVAWKEF